MTQATERAIAPLIEAVAAAARVGEAIRESAARGLRR